MGWMAVILALMVVIAILVIYTFIERQLKAKVLQLIEAKQEEKIADLLFSCFSAGILMGFVLLSIVATMSA